MSALGQKQTCALHKPMSALLNSDRESGFPQKAMSALPPKADMCGATRDVRLVPKADIEGISRCPLSANSGHRAASVTVSHQKRRTHQIERTD